MLALARRFLAAACVSPVAGVRGEVESKIEKKTLLSENRQPTNLKSSTNYPLWPLIAGISG